MKLLESTSSKSSYQDQVKAVRVTAISFWLAVEDRLELYSLEMPQEDIQGHDDQRRKRTSDK